MKASADNADNADSAKNAAYVSEVRFGIVMYGGVSLALYINGVANELYEMAQATPLPQPPTRPPRAGGTRQVYAWLSALMADDDLLERCRSHVADGGSLPDFFARDDVHFSGADRVRLVVDVVSGTSAGGINGIFLAQALANNESFSLLKDLWIDAGDFGKLLNEAAKPRSLLNSNYMYGQLHKALTDMGATRPAGGPSASTTVEELDLYVTTTDIRGATIELRLFDKTVPERRHRQGFHFQYRGVNGASAANQVVNRNDFVDANRSFLAYAARCTSSFPFAFEPMTLAAIVPGGGQQGDLAAWRRLFISQGSGQEGGRGDPLQSAYGDGGYLDNKPFGLAIEALSQRESMVPVERKLIYIEPSPAHPDDEDRARQAAGRERDLPNAVTNAMAALTEIPRYETIREDLEAVLQRNRMIERVDRIVGHGEETLALGSDADPYVQAMAAARKGNKTIPWDRMTLTQMRAFYGDAFLPYRRLRVYLVTDRLADRLATLWGVDPESDRSYAMRALVRVWRDAHFKDIEGPAEAKAGQPTLNGYLEKFDLRFRTRRLRFLIRRVDALYRLLQKRQNGSPNQPFADPLSTLHRTLLKRLQREAVDLTAKDLGQFSLDRALTSLKTLRGEFLLARDETLSANLDFERLGGSAAAERRAGLRDLLIQLLDLLLDTGHPKTAAVDPPQTTPPATQLADHLPDDVIRALNDLTRLPSSTRTLQERVYERARVLYEHMNPAQTVTPFHEPGLLPAAAVVPTPADATVATPLQKALEDDLLAMGELVGQLVKGTTQRKALARVNQQLGRPDWEFDDSVPGEDGKPRVLAYAKVGDTGVPALDTLEGKLLRRLLATYHLRFDSYDQMSLPLYYGSNVGEPSTVEVVRISPEDATELINERTDGLGRKKLAGTGFANFGGFLDEQWRRNDIMWGRFDGAERLIFALLPGQKDEAVRKALTRAAHLAIVDDELAPGERAQVTSLFLEALGKLSGSTGDDRVKKLLGALNPAEPARRKQLEQVLGRLFENEGLLDYVRTTRDVDRHLVPEQALQQAARATTVLGRVLQGISEGQRIQALPRWISRGGLLAQGLVAVSLPGSLASMIWHHGLAVLYLLEGLALALGLLLGSESTRSAGLTALVLTLSAQVASMALRDVMRERPPLRSQAVWAVLAVVLALAGLGGWALHRVPLSCLIGWEDCAAPPPACEGDCTP